MQSPPAFPPIEQTGWQSIRKLHPSGFTHTVEYWVRIRLPEHIPDPGALYARGWSPAFACYLSDSILAVHAPPLSEPHDRYRAPEWYVVQLPPGARGQMLYLWRPQQELLLDLEQAIVAPLSEPTGWKWIASLEHFILRSIQRGDLGYLALGMIFLTVGLVTFVVFLMRRENLDATLFFFSAMSVFFGSRYLTNTDTFRFWAGGTHIFWNKTVTTMGYLSGISAFSFFRCFLGPGWRSTITWTALAYSALACLAVPMVIKYAHPALILEVSNGMVIMCILVIVANICRPEMRRVITFRSFMPGLIAGGVFVVLDNLHGLGLVLLPFSIEWLGLTIIYISLGLLTAHRFFAREQHLVAIRQELETAKRIQTSILPRETPAAPGLKIALRYIPVAELAGDFYDFMAIDKARHGVLVADASGHGMSAALIASMIKVAFHAQAEHAADPERVLSGMNRSLHERLGDQFVTAGYAFIDMESRELGYAGAAHPPLLIRSGKSGDVEGIDNNGLMIGPFRETAYVGIKRRLEPGDRIMMYTDGISEAVNAKEEEYGERRLRKFLADSKQFSAEDFADKLLADVASWSGSNQDKPAADDLTVVVIDFQEDHRP